MSRTIASCSVSFGLAILSLGILTGGACQPSGGGGRRGSTPQFTTALDFGTQAQTDFAADVPTTLTVRTAAMDAPAGRIASGEATLQKAAVRVFKQVDGGRIREQATPDRVELSFLVALPGTDPCAGGASLGGFALVYDAAGTDFTIQPPSFTFAAQLLDLIFDNELDICVRISANFTGRCEIDRLDLSFQLQGSGTPTGPTGGITGTVVNAQTGDPLSGILVFAAGVSATSDSSGLFTLNGVRSGLQTVTASGAGFVPSQTPVSVVAGQTVEVSIGLLESTISADAVQVILSWGDRPNDLDLHLSGPDGGSTGGRFHGYFSNENPTTFVCLDLDDTVQFGPETMTIARGSDGSFVAGDYHVWIHNFSGSPEFDVSAAVVTLFAGGQQIAQFNVTAAAGNATLDIWQVVNFDLAADGSVTNVRPLQTFAEGFSTSVF